MNAVRQKCRPKHQVLVLKCYPRYQKNVQDVKPNSSELSYLLYYATTRRSKLQKVGAFLEKKTASDVWRVKLGNVQVTLQILTALIEKAPRDLPLYSGMVLTIIDTVLRSKDINMIEESLPTFEAYCKHQDVSAVTSGSERSSQYQRIAQTYASFASHDFLAQSKTPLSEPISIRWRTLGLRAIKAVVDSESFGADSGHQLSVVMPVILENLYSGDEDYISALQKRAQSSEKTDIEQARKRRMSVNTVATVDTIEANPLTAASTTADADKVAQEEVQVLAVRCLKQIFSAGYGSSRGQVRLATALTLRFIAFRKPPEISMALTSRAQKKGNWATSLIEAVARWTPVQDRFIIVVTAMETLTRSPIVEARLDLQLTLATMIDWLLSSTVNLIGLSVMDVLLGFVQHILLLLQLGGRESRIAPHQQQPTGLDLFRDTNETFNNFTLTGDESRGPEEADTSSTASPLRQDLLLRLQKCIGDLATHIYYTDQISDMIVAVLARLKPSANSDVTSAAAAIENPAAAVTAIANSVSLQEDSTTDGFFSFATARVTALRSVKDILVVANFRKSTTGSSAEARNRVGLHVWEGTQWLLRDEQFDVRIAYMEALGTWLQLETNRNDLHLARENARKVKSGGVRREVSENTEAKLAKRAASTASRKEKLTKPDRSTFLQLLHLAVYEDAVERPEDEANILLLHLVLSGNVERLGVNAARNGLPMILRLQEDLLNDTFTDARAKVNISSLVHGYLGALSEKFNFETSRVGAEIHSEISRRRQNGLWFDKIRLPAMPIEQIKALAPDSAQEETAPDIPVQSLKPFTNRAGIVEEIGTAYDEALASPLNSPPTSPGRVFSVPALGFGYGYGTTPHAKPAPEDQLPDRIRDEMLADWTREACIAALEKGTAQASSISGSKRTGTGSMPRNYLTVTGNGNAVNGNNSGSASPTYPLDHSKQQQGGRASPATYGLVGGLGGLSKLRRISTQEGSPTALTPSSSRESTVRVNELKRVLSVNQSNARHSSPLRTGAKSGPGASIMSASSDSMVSYSDADAADLSAVDINHTVHASGQDGAHAATTENQRPKSSPQAKTSIEGSIGHPKPSSQAESSSYQDLNKDYVRPGSRPQDDDIPPVPKIPSSLNLPGGFPQDGSPVRPSIERTEGPRQASPVSRRDSHSIHASPATDREGRSMSRGKKQPLSRREKAAEVNSWIATDKGNLFNHRVDLGKLLAGIDSGVTGGPPQETKTVGLSRPPY